MTSHKHAALMAEYAKDALETEEPWLRWELASKNFEGWRPLTWHPQWYDYCKYRRKLKTININGFEVPEPLRVPPAEGTLCWVVSPASKGGTWSFVWFENPFRQQYLAQGVIHLTQEAAEIHAKALLSFTEEKTK